MGKFIRHGIAMLAAAIMGTMLAWLGLTPDMLSPDQADAYRSVVAAFETMLWIFGTFVVYPFVEKWLKRFPRIDPEGAADRDAVKHEARMRGYK